MRKISPVLLLAAALAAPSGARAQHGARTDGYRYGPGPTGLSLGARLAVALPLGTAYLAEDAGGPFDYDLNQIFGAAVPIWLEAGYRFSPFVYVGGYLQLAPASVASFTCGGTGCSGSDQRLGVEVLYHFTPRAQFDPWVGLGLGYEWANWSTGAGDFGARGLEVLNLQLGADFRVSPPMRVGPFLMVTIGRYGTLTDSIPGQTVITDIGPAMRTHGWLQIGVKGTYDL